MYQTKSGTEPKEMLKNLVSFLRLLSPHVPKPLARLCGLSDVAKMVFYMSSRDEVAFICGD
jgi:hypothetical protein